MQLNCLLLPLDGDLAEWVDFAYWWSFSSGGSTIDGAIPLWQCLSRIFVDVVVTLNYNQFINIYYIYKVHHKLKVGRLISKEVIKSFYQCQLLAYYFCIWHYMYLASSLAFVSDLPSSLSVTLIC